MVESNGVSPPRLGAKGATSHAKPFEQIQTGMDAHYGIKGNTALRNWAKHWYPHMTDQQLDAFVKRFLSTLLNELNQQIKKEMARARKEARKLRRAEEGED